MFPILPSEDAAMSIRLSVHRLGAAALLSCLMAGPVAASPAAAPSSLDLIQDRPSALESAWTHSTNALSWTWDLLYDYVFDWVTPPSPTQVTSHVVSQEEAMGLVKLLGDAGYKLKEIETHVGLIPTLSFKFGQVRELSDADFDYLDAVAHDWYLHHPGMGTELQRTIVDTVISVNQGSEYQVSSLKVQLLPLPKVAFAVSPKVATLGEESSTLMRAIQRVERDLLGLQRQLRSQP